MAASDKSFSDANEHLDQALGEFETTITSTTEQLDTLVESPKKRSTKEDMINKIKAEEQARVERSQQEKAEREAKKKAEDLKRRLKNLRTSVHASEIMNRHFKTDTDTIPDSFAIFAIASDLETLLMMGTVGIMTMLYDDEPENEESEEARELLKQIENNFGAASDRARNYLQRLKQIAYTIPPGQFTGAVPKH